MNTKRVVQTKATTTLAPTDTEKITFQCFGQFKNSKACVSLLQYVILVYTSINVPSELVKALLLLPYPLNMYVAVFA